MIRRMNKGLLGLAMILICLAGRAVAQGQVYDAQPPAGSAYVRVVNALPGAAELRSPAFDTRRLGTQAAQRVMDYMVVPNVAGRPLRLDFAEGERRGQASIRLEPGSFVTVLLHRNAAQAVSATALVEQTEFNRARARLAFYNALFDCPEAGLSLLPGGQAVFAGVPALQTRSRVISPVSAELRAQCGDRATAAFPLSGLEAGGMYSIWLMAGQDGALGAFVTRDSTARWQQ